MNDVISDAILPIASDIIHIRQQMIVIHEIYDNKYYSKILLKLHAENFHDKGPVENLTGSLLLFFILFS